MTRRSTSVLAAALLAPALMLAGCSGDTGAQNGQAQNNGAATQGSAETSPAGATGTGAATPGATGTGAAAPAPTPREASKDVEVTKCEVADGVVTVEVTAKNSGDAEANYIVPVQVMQNDKQVDGVAVFVQTVKPGAEGKGTMQGQKTDLKGKVTCKLGDVQAM